MVDQQGSPPDPPIVVDIQGLDEIDLNYVNIIQVNQDPYMFQIAFARFVQPLTQKHEEQEAFRNRVLQEGIPAQAVARLLIVPSVLRDMVETLTRQIAIYEAQFGPIPRFQAEQPPSEDTNDGN